MTPNRISDIIQSNCITQVIRFDDKAGNDMISFEDFKTEDGIPIYLQIVQHIKRGIVAGRVLDNDELPSRRVLSALLGVNPNTVQKAYRMLEDEGIITSHSGAKSYAVLNESTVDRIKSELTESDVRSAVEKMKSLGLSRDDAIALVEKLW